MSPPIKDIIVELLLKKGPLPDGIEINEFRYLDSGHIDSLGLIKFIFELEERFDVTLSSEDIQSKEIGTVAGLVSLIEKKRCISNKTPRQP